MKSSNVIKDLKLWTLVVVILGGIFNYVFVTRLSTELANTEKHVRVTLDITSFLKDMQPNLQISASGINYTDKTTMDMAFDIVNLGAHVAIIEKPSLYLSTEPIFSSNNINSRLNEGVDYVLRTFEIGNVPPGQKVQQKFEIKFKNISASPDVIYYYTTFVTKTDWAVTKVAQNVLRDYLSKEEVQKLSARNYKRWGPVKVSPKPLTPKN
jgi:hypothetical protein